MAREIEDDHLGVVAAERNSRRSKKINSEALLWIAIGMLLLVHLAISVLTYRELRSLGARLSDRGSPMTFGGFVQVGAVAPGFDLVSTQGKSVALNNYRGRKTILAFVSPHCPHCIALFPCLAKLHAHTDAEIIVISEGDSASNRALIKQYAFDFPVVQATTEIAKAYGAEAVPLIYILNEAGVVSGRHLGAITCEGLLELADNRMTQQGSTAQ